MNIIIDVDPSIDDLDEAKKFYEDVADLASKTSFVLLHIVLRNVKEGKNETS